MTFKEKLVILRKSKGLTQDEFASAVGVSRQAVYKWESGQSYPEVPKLLEMKLLFTVSIDELLDDSYDIPLPEKKKRKRTPKAAKPVAPNQEPKAAPAPAVKPEAPKAAPAQEPKAAPAPAVKPEAPKATPAPAAKAAPAPAVKPEAPKAAPAPAAKAEPAPAAKPEAPKATPAPAAKAEPAPAAKPEAPKAEPVVDTVPSPIILEDIVAEEERKAENAPKKGGFFNRLFGRK